MPSIYNSHLEIRQVGDKGVVLTGLFPYSHSTEILERGVKTQEVFAPGAFSSTIQDASAPVELLLGHDFQQPLASRKAGNLSLREDAEGVEFTATLDADGPSWVQDAIKSVSAGLMGGLSPGFQEVDSIYKPPMGQQVAQRVITEALLREISVVTAPAYPTAYVSLRHLDLTRGRKKLDDEARAWVCL